MDSLAFWTDAKMSNTIRQEEVCGQSGVLINCAWALETMWDSGSQSTSSSISGDIEVLM